MRKYVLLFVGLLLAMPLWAQQRGRPLILSHPEDQTICPNAIPTDVTFTVVVKKGVDQFQWQVSDPGVMGYENIPDATNKELTLEDIDLTYDGKSYRCIVGNSASGESQTSDPALLSIEDVTDPELTCPQDPTVTACDGEQYTVEGTELDAEVSDNCGIDKFYNDVNSEETLAGESFPLGKTTVEWTASDIAGNEVSCTYDIMVVADIIDPEITCPQNTTVTACDGEQYTVEGTELDATAEDDCAITLINTVNDGASLDGELFNTGVHDIKWTARDQAGNETVCVMELTVLDDQIPPVPNIAELPEITGECSAVITTTPTATDNCDGQIEGETKNPLEYTEQGQYTVTWRYTDEAGNKTKQGQIVTIKDVTDPELTCPQNITVTACAGEQYTVTGTELDAIASDNCKAIELINSFNKEESLKGETFPLGKTTIEWATEDIGGNKAECTHDIVVITDIVAPEITCPQNITVTACDGEQFTVEGTELDATAEDDCAIALGNSVNEEVSLDGVSFATGTHEIVWKVEDQAGNKNKCTHKLVVVADIIDPTITCPNSLTVTADGSGQYALKGTNLDPETDDNCEVASVSNSFNDAASLSGAIFTPGTYDITWTVTDAAGNTAECTFTLTVLNFTTIAELAKQGIKLYPNPTSNKLQVELSNPKEVKRLTVINLTGQPIREINKLSTLQKIDLSDQASGIYLLKVTINNNKVLTAKIIKE